MIRRMTLGIVAAALSAAAFVAPSQAAIPVESFTTTTTTTQAGGHPDLTTSFTLAGTASGIAKNIEFNAPEGLFGNPNAISRCTASDFVVSECPVSSQAGIVTVWGEY